MTETTTVRGVVRNGTIEWRQPLHTLFDEGEEVELHAATVETANDSIPDSDEPLTPEQIQTILSAMNRMSGEWFDAEDQAAFDKRRAEQKAWEFAHWDERARKLREMFP